MSGENVVDVDPSALAAEAAAVDVPPAPEAEPEPGAAPAGDGAPAGELTLDQAEALAASYEAAAVVLYGQAVRIIAPNWRVTDTEVRDLAHATAVALALWFPDQQLPPKYAALLSLAGTAYMIAETRRDPATGRIRPMRAAPERSTDAEPEQAPVAPARGGGSFVVGGVGGAG